MVLMANTFPKDKCPKCGKDLLKSIEKLEQGGFVWLIVCPESTEHYREIREPSFREAQEFNG